MGIRSRNYTVSDAPLRIRELFEPMSVPAAVTQFFFMMAYGVIEVYVAIYAASCHLPGGGIYFIFIALATVGTRILLGRAVDRYGEARLVYTGNAAIVAGILLLIFAHNVPCYQSRHRTIRVFRCPAIQNITVRILSAVERRK